MPGVVALAALDPLDALAHIGPGCPAWGGSLDDATVYVQRFTARANENFTVLSSLVPADLRRGFAAVYAFCRWADDLGDETGLDEAARARSLVLLAWWRTMLDRAIAGDPGHAVVDHPVMGALSDVIRRHALSPEHFHNLIDAFEQDQRITRYATWDQVVGYCEKSANPVGRLIIELGGVPMSDVAVSGNPEAAETRRLSDLVCTALQLTNHWQDVRRDLLERDRIYLPMDECGLTESDLRRGIDKPHKHALRARYIKSVRGLVDRTRQMYIDAGALPDRLPASLASVVWLLGEGGRQTLELIEHTGNTTLWQRPKLGTMSKAWILLRAKLRSVRARLSRGRV